MSPRTIQQWLRRQQVLALAFAFLALGPVVLTAQEYRATLLGTVTDPAGAVVPEARVTIVNTGTGVLSETKTTGDGYYIVPFLLPGNYRLTVERAGFKTTDRNAIQLRTSERVRIDVKLNVGELSERITVTSESPLLETASAERGQVTGTAALTILPIKGNNPWQQVALAPGVLDGNNPVNYRQQDTSTTVSINGGRSNVVGSSSNPFLNEKQIDGQGRDIGGGAIPIEAVAEIKVVTSMYDAQYGHTSGGVIAMSIKSGTNQLHGAAYWIFTRTALTANSFSNNSTGTARTLAHKDEYGFELDGPVFLPKVYNGKDRTFFTFSMEKWKETKPGSALTTVPTALERAGDFSQSYLNATTPYTIYDPLTLTPNPSFDPTKSITLTNLQYIRTPFAGNVVPQARMNPVGLNVLKFIPLPSGAGNAFTHANNFYGPAGNQQLDDFKFLVARVDHNFNPKWKMYARYDMHDRAIVNDNGINGWGTQFDPVFTNINHSHAAVVDLVGVLNSKTILNLKVGTNFTFGRYALPRPAFDQVKQLGLPPALVNQLDVNDRFPGFSLQNYSGISSSDRLTPLTNLDVGNANASLVRTQGAHSIHVGFEYRPQYYGNLPFGGSAGSYSFNRSWTSSNPNVDNTATGNAVASMLLGYLGSASATHNTGASLSWRYLVGYFQDDWRLNRRLIVNWGLRWDYESPVTERWNRQIRGFDYNSPSPLRVPGLNLTGGLLFAGVNGQPRGAFNPDRENWQPRLGVAYKLSDRRPVVFRGGIGRVFLPTSQTGLSESGASTPWGATTAATTSTAAFMPAATFTNPFPTGLLAASGASQGLATLVGTSLGVNDLARHTPLMWQYSAAFQYELIPGLLLEVGYSGSNTRWLPVSRSLKYYSLDQLALGQPYLNAAVTNPFYGILPASTSLGSQATISRGALLQPYPQFSGLTSVNNSFGYSWYNSLQVRVEHRMKHGLWFQAGYTLSKNLEAVSLLNPQDINMSRQKAIYDRPQRFVTSVTYHLPVGPKTGLLSHGLISHIVGGWDLSAEGFVQSGLPLQWSGGGYSLSGNPALSSGQSLSHWFDTTTGAGNMWVALPAGSLRVIPLVSQNIRTPTMPQFSGGLARSFQIHEHHKLQFRAFAFNFANTPVFGAPNTDPASSLFGRVTLTQTNLPRLVDLSLRYSF